MEKRELRNLTLWLAIFQMLRQRPLTTGCILTIGHKLAILVTSSLATAGFCLPGKVDCLIFHKNDPTHTESDHNLLVQQKLWVAGDDEKCTNWILLGVRNKTTSTGQSREQQP